MTIISEIARRGDFTATNYVVNKHLILVTAIFYILRRKAVFKKKKKNCEDIQNLMTCMFLENLWRVY